MVYKHYKAIKNYLELLSKKAKRCGLITKQAIVAVSTLY